MSEQKQRCGWAVSELMIAYHDQEWGVPVHDDRTLFEFLILEGAQAGLSWETILSRRPAYRKAFDNFDPAIIAAYDQRKVDELLANAGIIRNRRKIEAAVTNARTALRLQEEFGSLDAYFWSYCPDGPLQGIYGQPSEVPVTNPVSDRLSKDLIKRGFKFVGPTIMCAFMHAAGMMNGHLVTCFRHEELKPHAR